MKGASGRPCGIKLGCNWVKSVIRLRIQVYWRWISCQGDDPRTFYVFLLNGWTNALYWSFGLSLIFMEYCNKPKEFFKYKIQPDKSALKDIPKLRYVSELSKAFRAFYWKFDFNRPSRSCFWINLLDLPFRGLFMCLEISSASACPVSFRAFRAWLQSFLRAFSSKKLHFTTAIDFFITDWFINTFISGIMSSQLQYLLSHNTAIPSRISSAISFRWLAPSLFWEVWEDATSWLLYCGYRSSSLRHLTTTQVRSSSEISEKDVTYVVSYSQTGHHLPFLHSSEIHDYHHLT